MAVREVIESGWVTQGPRVARFEKAFAEMCHAKDAVAVSSCTTALHLCLLCSGVGPGDEVIVPSMSFIATANAVVHAGATPVFAEVDPETFNLDADDVRRRITPRTRAIILVHQLGLPAAIDTFTELAADRGLQVIEDAACATGSGYRGAPIGSHSALVCFSFHPRKLLTTGDGGMITTSSPQHAARLRLLRHHGMSISDTVRSAASTVLLESYVEIGFNYRMTDVQAAIGLAQLGRLPAIVDRRRILGAQYDAAFADHPIIATPRVPPEAWWNVQSYAVRLRGFDAACRNAVMQDLLDRGIATRAGVMTSHRQPAYAKRSPLSLPRSEAASDGSLQLPLFVTMTQGEQEEVVAALNKAVERNARVERKP
jgi:dTDP-4-amino-4,6-dideoxygalactose transaminase